MTSYWFVGDLHFGHVKVAAIRGFETPYSHDMTIMDKWDRQVREEDVVYVLGDISSGREEGEAYALRQLSYLPGKKRLIAGNHDSISGIHRKISPHINQFHEVFENVADFGRIRMDKEDVLLSHYPYTSQGDGPGRGASRYAQFRLPDLGEKLIHAHTHHSDPFSGSVTAREMCVSWDAWNRLVGISDIAAWVEKVDSEGVGQCSIAEPHRSHPFKYVENHPELLQSYCQGLI